MIYLLAGFALAGALIARRRHRNRSTRQPTSGTVLDLAWSWALSAWPQAPSPMGVTRRLVRWAVAERLPISSEMFIAPSEVTMGIHPLEFDALEGRHEAVELAVEEAMVESATRLGWRSMGRPRVWIEVDEGTSIGWPTVRPSYRRTHCTSEEGPKAEVRQEPPTVVLPAHEMTTTSALRDQPTTHTRDHLILPNGEVLALPPLGSTIMGRGYDVDVVIVDAEVSKSHAAIRSHNGRTWLEDLSSTNGTYVDGQAINSATELASEVTIRLGPAGPALHFLPARARQETRPRNLETRIP